MFIINILIIIRLIYITSLLFSLIKQYIFSVENCMSKLNKMEIINFYKTVVVFENISNTNQ